MISQARNCDRWQSFRKLLASHPIARELLVRDVAFLFFGSALNFGSDFGVNFLFLFAPPWLEVFGIEDHVYDSAGLCNSLNHVIGEIPRHVGDSAATGMCRDHRCG